MKQELNQNTDVDVKESILEATTALIRESDGDLRQVTMREIAHRAEVSVGLINYHFKSKKSLIERCVERIIHQVIDSFKFREDAHDGPIDRLLSGTCSVFAFLKENPEIAKVSILSDLTSPRGDGNSAVSYRGILRTMPEGLSEEKKRVMAFMLLSTIQSAFLTRTLSNDLFHVDLDTDEGAHAFFKSVIDVLFAAQ